MVIEAAVKVVGSTRPESLFEKTTLLKGSHFAKEVENSSIALIEDTQEGRNVSEANRFNKKN